jgi:hypothetical protein
METFIKIINCCYQEEEKANQNNNEIKVPITHNETLDIENKPKQNENQIIIDLQEPLIIEPLKNNKRNSNNNNNLTLNNTNTNNTSNNNIITDESINNNLANNKSINVSIGLRTPLSPPRKKLIYSNSIQNNKNFSQIFNNNNFDMKKMANSLISKSNPSKNNKSNNTILTLNDLIFMNQNQEEKNNEIIGSKLLLSGELFFWKDIILSSNGIKNSLRKDKDEHVFFGVKNILNKSGESFNDLIINFFYKEEDIDLMETDTGRAFEIFYNKRSREYILRFLHPNIILYYRINTFVYFYMGREYYFLLGNVFMSVNVKKKSPIEKVITIEIEIENNKPMKYTFNQNQAPIKIGRANCEVNILNSSISKKHGIIEYSKNSQSFYFKDMNSTNGSTLIIKAGDTLKIKGEMNFKLEDVPFKVQEIP